MIDFRFSFQKTLFLSLSDNPSFYKNKVWLELDIQNLKIQQKREEDKEQKKKKG